MKVFVKFFCIVQTKLIFVILAMTVSYSNTRYLLVEIEQPKTPMKAAGRMMGKASARMIGNDNISPSKDSSLNSLAEHSNFSKINRKECGLDRTKQSSSRIIGGSESKKGEFPWLALLRKTPHTNWMCGGSLINELWVLTAAHCVTNESKSCKPITEEKMEVMLGQHDKRKTSNVVIEASEKIIPHKEFSYCTGKSDIALIKLKKSIDLKINKNINTVCLPLKNEKAINGGLKVTVAGYGNTKNEKDEDGTWTSTNSANIMKRLDTSLIDTIACDSAHDAMGRHYSILKEQNICTKALEGQDSCQGDSGGPLMTSIKNEKLLKHQWIQVGLVSWGNPKCGLKGIPGVYTNVKTYLKWILDNLD